MHTSDDDDPLLVDTIIQSVRKAFEQCPTSVAPKDGVSFRMGLHDANCLLHCFKELFTKSDLS